MENGDNNDFFSIMQGDSRRFAIQNKSNFHEYANAQLGLEIVEDGIFTISIDSFEGVFEDGQRIYLQDNETGTIHNLNYAPYTFFIARVEDLRTRFVLRFTDETTAIDDVLFNSISIYPNPSNGVFNLTWSSSSEMQIKVSDVSGKEIISKHNITNETGNHSLDLSSYTSGVYFVTFTSENNRIVKKLVIK
jgi:hypothetical protein